MVNWSDPHEMAAEGDAFVKIIYCLFGLYVWEVFLTSGFEWAIIRGRRKIAWPLIFFFLCRYCMLLAFIGLIISFSVKTKINCIALYTFISFAGNTTILGASTSLAIRTMALWEWRPLIISAIGALSLVHWGLLIRGMFIVRAQWSDQAQVCVVDYTNHTLLNVTFFYTMGFDCAIMVFTAVALGKRFRNAGLTGLLFRDGLVYFLISFTCNIFPAVLNVLNLNVEMNVIATVPAVTISAIAACRAVIRLKEYNHQESAMPSPNLVTTFGGNILPLSPKSRTSFKSVSPRKPMRPEVRVTTDSYTLAEFTPTSGTLTASTSMRSPKSPYGKDWPEPDSDRTSSDSDHARPPKLEIIDENGQLTPHSPHSVRFNAV